MFRADTGMAVTPELWGAIAAALDQSDHLLLLASPAAAQSSWVGREIEHRTQAKPAGRVLIVVTDGELRWDADRNDFDPDHSTALPPPLLGVFPSEPRWLDLRWARSEDQLDLRHSRFRDAITQLAAPLHGRPREDLESDDVRRHPWGTGTRSMGSLAVALSPQLDRIAAAGLDGAVRLWSTIGGETIGRLLGHAGPASTVAFSPDSKLLASSGDDGFVRLWAAGMGESRLMWRADRGAIRMVAFRPDGGTISPAGPTTGAASICLRARARPPRPRWPGTRSAERSRTAPADIGLTSPHRCRTGSKGHGPAMTIQRHLDDTFTQWSKSSYSSIEGVECVEVSFSGNAVGMRDSHDPHGAVLTFDHGAWAAFLDGATASEFRPS